MDPRSLSRDTQTVNSVLRTRGRAAVKPPEYHVEMSFSADIEARERPTRALSQVTLQDAFNLVYGPRESAAYMALRFPRVFAAVSRVLGEVGHRTSVLSRSLSFSLFLPTFCE